MSPQGTGLAGSSLGVGAEPPLLFWSQLGSSLGDMARPPPALQLKNYPQTPRENHGQLRNAPAGDAGLNSRILGVALPPPIRELCSQAATVISSNPLNLVHVGPLREGSQSWGHTGDPSPATM